MPHPIYYYDRISKKLCKEKVYGIRVLTLLYGENKITKYLAKIILVLITRWSFFSAIYGYFQKRPSSKKKITPFIKTFELDASEFLSQPDNFKSFNDFFTRKLKPSCRPITPDPESLCIPADARYLVKTSIKLNQEIWVKNKSLNMSQLLGNEHLAQAYIGGDLVIARLCPTDYHRFHSPASGKLSPALYLKGSWQSVNPIATKQNINIFSENKRFLLSLHTSLFGTILYIPIAATNVGSIRFTFNQINIQKGEEIGFFSFGASSIIMLIPPNKINLDKDLIANSLKNYETRALLGQNLASLIKK